MVAAAPSYLVPSTGARATLQNAQVLLHGYVARLPGDK